jgi:hypothetical protein
MTFSQFLSQREGAVPRFIEEANGHELWPAESSCLEDFEGFLRAHAAEPTAAVEELRAAWREYALHPANRGAKHHLDLVLARWRDYAAHLQRCVRHADTCRVGEELFEAALDESDFSNLDSTATSACCDPSDATDADLAPADA